MTAVFEFFLKVDPDFATDYFRRGMSISKFRNSDILKIIRFFDFWNNSTFKNFFSLNFIRGDLGFSRFEKRNYIFQAIKCCILADLNPNRPSELPETFNYSEIGRTFDNTLLQVFY